MRVKGFTPWWRTKAVLLPVLAVAAVGCILYLRSRDDSSERTVAARQLRYCELASQFETVALSTGVDAPPESYRTVTQHLGSSLEEMESSAPAEVRDEVRAMVGALRDAASGDVKALQSSDFSDAIRNTAAYRARSCPGGSGEDPGQSGEG